ncbi:MAG: MG2 domain-containing protein [Pseudorhodoplanes sp.]
MLAFFSVGRRAALAFARALLIAISASGGLLCLSAFAHSSAFAADKAFTRDDLADATVRLEAQIKTDAGKVDKAPPVLRRDAEAAFARNDFRGGLQLLGQLVAIAPDDASNWLRLARAVQALRPTDQRERTLLLERAGTAAYAAYRRTRDSGEEAAALRIIGTTFAERKLWRPALDALRLSLEAREVADVRQQYEKLRMEWGFRLLDYSVDADAASPRACFQFSEKLPAKRIDFSPFVSVAGMDKPALSVDDKQLCVEGLRHGDRYNVSLRPGLPSMVAESLATASEFNIYVRDRKPFVRFTGKQYVLPKTGQRGIPIVSTNTRDVVIDIYRVGDRNLLNAVLGGDFQRSLSRSEMEELGNERGVKVWSGKLAVEAPLNADVTTAFPVDQAVGDMQPGVYAIFAQPDGPVKDEESYEQLATQWFIVSDLGVSAYSGNDGIHAFVHSLATTAPMTQTEVRLLSRSNEVLATRKTDANGRAYFEPGLTRGEGGMSPAMLVAAKEGGDYAFLNLKGPAFDLTDRGVQGRAVPAGLDAFVYTERGVYRSGETVHITALLRDPQGVAAIGTPMTIVIERPDGVEYRRVAVADQGVGGRSLSLPLAPQASTGTWRVRSYTDPKRPPVGETTFMVEDYVPDRIEFSLNAKSQRLQRGAPAEIALDGKYLYGAPASDLSLEGEVDITVAKERAGFAGYRFGNADEEYSPAREELSDLPNTDANGKATLSIALDKIPDSTRPLEAAVTVRMAEAGGRAVERKIVLPIEPVGPMIGVKPLFNGSLGDGEMANFDVVVVQPDGASVARQGLRYELLKVDTRYQYYRRDGSWDYEPIKTTRRVADGTINVAQNTPARLSLPTEFGRYRLEVSSADQDGPSTTISFDSGYYAEASADTPDVLEIALDRAEFKPGDTMNVAVTARAAGRVTLDIYGNRLLTSTSVDVQPGTARVPVTIGRDWGSSAYVVATLRRPLDAQAQRMPGRAIGLQWFAIDRKARTLALDMTLPQLQRPNTAMRIPVKVGGLSPGEDARIVVAAVDVGILNLTNYKPPAPDDYYLGQRRLTAELRDLYGQLIDGMQGSRGAIRSGGDSAGGELNGSPPVQKPLALYSGLVQVDSSGNATINFDVPAFNGTLRVMAVAWSRDKVGKATGDVFVRDPVVLTATLPRFLLVGDNGSMTLEIDNVEGAAGDYRVAVAAEGGVSVGDKGRQPLKLAARQRTAIKLPLSPTRVGQTQVNVRMTGPNNFLLERAYALDVKPATQVLVRRTIKPIAKGESLTLSGDLFADLVPGSGGVALSVGPSVALDAATLLKALDRYPFGCSEQITSRALPLLYVNELASEAQLALDASVDQRIRDAIERLLARQGSNGSFGLWSVGGDDTWLDAYVTDFLTRARERGFTVPDTAFQLAVTNLRNAVNTAPDVAKDGGRDLAYALYVLARNGLAPIGDLRYLADTKLKDIATPIAKAQLAAALGLVGDRTRAERVYASALESIQPKFDLFSRADYGSNLRDAAAFVSLGSEGNAPRATLMTAVQRIEVARAATTYTSTQENAWLVLAARAMSKDNAGLAMDVNGEARKSALYRNAKAEDLAATPIKVTNNGDGALQAVVSVSGAPLVPEPASANGFKIERSYHTLDGEAVDVAIVKQNTRLAVVLKITESEPQYGRIIVADYLPAGFEIDNPRLVSSGDTGTLDWIEDAEEPVNSEFRDDRFTAAFSRSKSDKAVFTVAYIVRAVSPGQYVLPQAYVEDMYRPERYGRTATGKIEVTGK